MTLYICTKFLYNTSKDFKVMEQTRFPNTNFQRRIISKNTDGVMVLVHCTSSGDALYLYQDTKNISKGFKVIGRTRFPK